MSDRPAFQFYPKDWRNNAKLRRCSPAARGVWVDLLCLLHDSDEYGVLRWPLKEIAQAAGASMAHVRELVDKGVLKGAERRGENYIHTPRHAGKAGEPVTLVSAGDGPCWYSSRFVKDEWLRQRRGAGTRFDSENQPPSRAPAKQPSGAPDRSPSRRVGEPQGDGPSIASSSATSGSSEANASAASAAAAKTPEELTKAELWAAGKSLLREAGMPEAQCGSFIGKLAGDYKAYPDLVHEAVRTAVVAQPADPASFLVATCQRMAGQRKPVNKQEAIEADGKRVVREWLAQQGEHA